MHRELGRRVFGGACRAMTSWRSAAKQIRDFRCPQQCTITAPWGRRRARPIRTSPSPCSSRSAVRPRTAAWPPVICRAFRTSSPPAGADVEIAVAERGRPPLVALAVFAIAFGIEEAIIVTYLRQLPAAGLAVQTYHLEIGRETCTLLVLGAVAWISGSSASVRVRSFLMSFGLWDVAYYAALWALTGTPGIANNDVLFLIPVPWFAPVW